MMDRIPEKELMDGVEQAKAYDEADFSGPHDAFVDYFRKRFSSFKHGKVIDLGCGTADVTIRFTASYPEISMIGIDGAQAMLERGINNVVRRNLTGRITFLKCRIPDRRLCSTSFDAVISNSLLHHLADPLTLWQCIMHCAKKGAPILIMDLLRPPSEEKAAELVALHAPDSSPVLRDDFYHSLLAAYSVEEIRGQLDRSGFQYLETEIVSDRHVLIWGRLS